MSSSFDKKNRVRLASYRYLSMARITTYNDKNKTGNKRKSYFDAWTGILFALGSWIQFGSLSVFTVEEAILKQLQRSSLGSSGVEQLRGHGFESHASLVSTASVACHLNAMISQGSAPTERKGFENLTSANNWRLKKLNTTIPKKRYLYFQTNCLTSQYIHCMNTQNSLVPTQCNLRHVQLQGYKVQPFVKKRVDLTDKVEILSTSSL